MTYTRKLSPVERFSLALNCVSPYNVVVIVEGMGDITHDQLSAAVLLAAEANPGARVRLRGFLAFSKWVDSGIPPDVHEIVNTDWNGRSERGAEFLAMPFDPLQGGPSFDVTMVRGDMLRLVFRGCHAAIDGRGMLHWVEEVFRALRGEPLLGSPATECELDIMKKFQHKIPAAVRNTNNELLPLSLPAIPHTGIPNGPTRYIWRTITVRSEPSNALPKMAVFLAEYARRQGDGPVSFTIPVDLRTLRAPLLSIGNLFGRIHIAVAKSDSPRQVMKHIVHKLRDYTDCWIAPIAHIVPWMPMKKVISEVRKFCARGVYSISPDFPTAGLVSIGSTPLENFSGPGFVATHFIGLPAGVGKMNVVFCNTGDQMTVTFGVPEAYNSIGQLDTLIEAYQDFARI